jgi:hypothetical protein
MGGWALSETNILKSSIFMAIIFFGALLSGCGGDKDLMEKGLVRAGKDATKAKCLAEKMAAGIKGETYDYLAKMLNEGVPERDAINKTRRKYSADFKSQIEEAEKACGQ